MSASNDYQGHDDELKRFFSELEERLDLATDYESRILGLKAPRFSMFTKTYIKPDENTITRILADLLRPNGSHGQGSVFLEQFLQQIGFGRACEGGIGKPLVRTEHRTGKNRRIDLTIRNGEYILGLENKITARLQDRQIQDYIDYLSSKSRKWFFVYLHPKGLDPENCDQMWNELKEQDRVRTLSYTTLSHWLHDWMALSKSDRVRELLNDMSEWAKHPTAELAADNFAEKVAADFVRGHQPATFDPEVVARFVRKYKRSDNKLVRSALAVINDCSFKNELIKDFAEALEETLITTLATKLGCREEWSLTKTISNHNLADKNPGIFFRRRSWPEGCNIGIEATKISEKFCFGISRWASANPDTVNALNTRLNAVFPEYGYSSANKYWIWCPWIDPDLGGIDMSCWYSRETMESMHDERNDTLIDSYVELLISVAEIVDECFHSQALQSRGSVVAY